MTGALSAVETVTVQALADGSVVSTVTVGLGAAVTVASTSVKALALR